MHHCELSRFEECSLLSEELHADIVAFHGFRLLTKEHCHVGILVVAGYGTLAEGTDQVAWNVQYSVTVEELLISHLKLLVL